VQSCSPAGGAKELRGTGPGWKAVAFGSKESCCMKSRFQVSI
jgi:hypothetical protein